MQYKDIPHYENELENLNSELSKSKFLKLEVSTEDIAELISVRTGIPVNKMLAGEQVKLLELETSIKRRIIGQDEAVTKVADVIRMSKVGISDRDRPLGSFLFMGNTGVGKTELAKTLAETLFDDDRALVRVDMSEYMEQHSVAKLIGSPPGYVGYDEGGQLTEKIRRRPYSAILFDEIEKAHPSVLNILLQILDDGQLTDSKGRRVNFKNTIVVMTSNLKYEEMKQQLRPEFINRIDEIVTFNDLDSAAIDKIIELQLSIASAVLKNEGIDLIIEKSVKAFIKEYGFQPEYGARPIKRTIKQRIMAPTSKYLLMNPDAKTVRIGVEAGTISVRS